MAFWKVVDYQVYSLTFEYLASKKHNIKTTKPNPTQQSATSKIESC
jgi:hypothetical protein